MDRKESQHFRLYILAALVLAVMLLYTGVLYDTQVTNHEEYLAASQRSIARVETVTAARGIITDRNGRTLVSNASAYNLTFDKSLLKPGEDANAAILRLLELCEEWEVEWTDTLPMSQHAPYGYQFSSATSTQRSNFLQYLLSLKEAKALLGTYLLENPSVLGDAAPEFSPETTETEKKAALLEALTVDHFTTSLLLSATLTSEAILAMMRSSCDIPADWSDADARKVVGIQYELKLRALGANNNLYVLAEPIETEFISVLADGNYAGAKVSSSYIRQYETPYAAHILGTVSRYQADDRELLAGKGYDGDDWIGRSGVEAAFEDYLRGTDGKRVVSSNADGKTTGVYYSKEPQPGNTVELTIDLTFQAAVEEALKATVDKMDAEDGRDDRGAGAAVIKVGTGEVLALASYPTFDLSTYRQDIALLNADPARPEFNRATQGTYAPGSTLKPLTAVAALETDVVSIGEYVRDTGRWAYPGDPNSGAKCWIYPGAHGKVDVTEAIRVSCNYYFAEMGYRLGMDTLVDYLKAFGLGESTGIEIGERTGTLPSNNVGENQAPWAAFGQANQLYSPLQLANYIATLVSGGRHCEAHLLKAVKSYDNSEVVALGDTTAVNTISISDATLQAVKEGMHELTKTTLAGYFSQCVVDAGAKTGTAQVFSNQTNNGVFVCFAPYDEPEIAVAIVIEKGGSGGALASTAVEILNAYFSEEEIGVAVVGENELRP
ncbi:MAG: penicillin-binding protein A [Oscillibacter sp.]|nr:penicillin-binding protein A [Oscillibacter sp.]